MFGLAAREHSAADAATKVAQTSKSAVSRVSQPAASTAAVGLADLEIGDTAGLETCATKSGGHCLEKSSRLVTILTDSSTCIFPDFAGKKRFACGEQPEVFADVIFGA